MDAWSDELRDEVDQFLVRHAVAASRFGKAVANDANLVFELRRGRSVAVNRADRIRAYIRGFDAGVAHSCLSPTSQPPSQIPGPPQGADAPGEGDTGGPAARQGPQPAGQAPGEPQEIGR